MAHDYSIQIQNYISEKLTQAKDKIKNAQKKNDIESSQFYKGQQKELLSLRKYLTENIDLNTQEYY